MDQIAVFLGFMCLGLIIGGVLGWVAIFQIHSLKARIRKLEAAIQSSKPEATSGLQNKTPTPHIVVPSKGEPTTPPPSKTAAAQPSPPTPPVTTSQPIANVAIAASAKKSPPQKPPITAEWLHKIQANWMVWLGGACVGLAGIFLARYSIEKGLLGPTARIILGLITGISFHLFAEWLRQRSQFARDITAALAGGASIILYAALLAALHMYSLIPPGLTFALLFAVSLVTMVLALWHGPILAGLGILGAYVVPLLVSTGSNNVEVALIYSLIITVSALFLMRFIFRPWLWIGTLVGACAWWALSFSGDMAAGGRTLYIVALAYCILAIARGNWTLQQTSPIADQQGLWQILSKGDNTADKRHHLALIVLIAMHVITVIAEAGGYHQYWSLVLLPALCFWQAKHKPLFSLLPWLTLAGIAVSLLLQFYIANPSEQLQFSAADQQLTLLLVLIELALLYNILSLWNFKSKLFPGLWSSLAFLGPLILMAVGYLRIEFLHASWEWSGAAALLGAFYMHLVYRQQQRSPPPQLIVSLILGAHCAYSLAVAMYFREATLTLALAVQLISLAWLDSRFKLNALTWIIKGFVAVVLLRLSLNPWLLSYSSDSNWPLWTYGGSLVCCLLAKRLLVDRPNLDKWLQGAAMHLFALLLIMELRYWLYDGAVFSSQYSFLEASLNTVVWGTLGCVYHYRSGFAGHLAKLYRAAAIILLLLALANHIGMVLLLQNPLWNRVEISATPIWNILLVSYGLPIVILVISIKLLDKTFHRFLSLLTAFSIFYFFTIEVRHLWQRRLDWDDWMSSGELYTYSVVWLMLAVAGMIAGTRFNKQKIYKSSMLFLLFVIGKIFLFDMAGLSGLLRVASFMGLGLSLLGLAYFHKLMTASEPNSNPAP